MPWQEQSWARAWMPMRLARCFLECLSWQLWFHWYPIQVWLDQKNILTMIAMFLFLSAFRMLYSSTLETFPSRENFRPLKLSNSGSTHRQRFCMPSSWVPCQTSLAGNLWCSFLSLESWSQPACKSSITGKHLISVTFPWSLILLLKVYWNTSGWVLLCSDNQELHWGNANVLSWNVCLWCRCQ